MKNDTNISDKEYQALKGLIYEKATSNPGEEITLSGLTREQMFILKKLVEEGYVDNFNHVSPGEARFSRPGIW